MTINQTQKRNLQINHTKLMQCDDNISHTKPEKTTKKNLLLVVFFKLPLTQKPT